MDLAFSETSVLPSMKPTAEIARIPYRPLAGIPTGPCPAVERPEQQVEENPTTSSTVGSYNSRRCSSRNFLRRRHRPSLAAGDGPRSTAAHYWIRDFFSSWFLHARQDAPSLEAFGAVWRELIVYSLEAPRWTGEMARSYRLEDCAIEVMGLGLMLDHGHRQWRNLHRLSGHC